MDEYRYKRFTTSLLFRDLRFRKDAAAPGDAFPKFELITTDGSHLDNGDVFGDVPVIIIFGSMTCPMTASAAPSVQELHEEFGDRIKFIMLYVREAHPGEHFTQADTLEQKLAHAQALKDFYAIQWTVAADNVDGDLHRALDPKPNSAFLINKDGTILFRSLWAADYRALRVALDAAATDQPMPAEQSTNMLGPLVKAMGYVHEVMKRGGPQATKDLWRAGLPMALAGRVAIMFSGLSPNRRGLAAVVSLMFGMLLTFGLLSALLFN
jgi:thiol-disulfide isomerase/thioredoxin